MPELTDHVHAEIKRLCAEGDALAERRDYPKALRTYWAAMGHASRTEDSMGSGHVDSCSYRGRQLLNRDLVAGRDNLSNAMHWPDAIGNPFLHLRLGQCQFELKALDRAADELMRAYMGGGPKLFKLEDPKYIQFLQTKAEGKNRRMPLEKTVGSKTSCEDCPLWGAFIQ